MRLRRLALAAIVTAGALVGAGSAHAITDGEPDGNQHPAVGILLFYTPEGRFRCTGTLVSPTVVLTAAHCTDGQVGKTIVSFDTFIAEAAPSGIPTADPTTGYTRSPGVDSRGRTWYAGTAHTAPAYSGFTDMDNWNDYGVVVLDKKVAITPMKVAKANYLDAYAQPDLNKTLFTLVGYGTRIDKPATGPQKPQPLTYPLLRRVTTAPGQKLTPQILQMNGNGTDTRGGGGTCFGDSGGPAILNNRVVGVTSYGYTDNCRYIDGYQRVDISIALDWLRTFGVTPG